MPSFPGEGKMPSFPGEGKMPSFPGEGKMPSFDALVPRGGQDGLFPRGDSTLWAVYLGVFAQVGDGAFAAAGLARLAYVAAVQDQPVVGVLQSIPKG